MDTQHLLNIVGTTLFNYGLDLLWAIIIFIVGYLFAKLARRMCLKLLNVRHVEKTISLFVSRMLYYAIIVFSIIAALSKLGVQTASLIAIIGAAGLAVAFSLRSSLSNLASGILLIIFRPFKVGDYIAISSQSGTVEEISILYTTIITSQNLEVIIPNTKFMGDYVTNYSAKPTRRAEIIVGIGYDDDIKKAKDILATLIGKDTRVEKTPKAQIGVKELANSSVNLFIRTHIKREHYWQYLFETNEAIKNSFDAAGISIPYPQQDVHVVNRQTIKPQEKSKL